MSVVLADVLGLGRLESILSLISLVEQDGKTFRRRRRSLILRKVLESRLPRDLCMLINRMKEPIE